MLQLVQAVIMTFLMLPTCSGQSQVAGDVQSCQGRKLYPAGTGAALSAWLDEVLAQNTTCATALAGLKTCGNDSISGNTTNNSSTSAGSSLIIKEGCCSAPCAIAVDQALIASGPGCYRSFLDAACNSSSANLNLSEPLLGLAKRCIGLNATCAALNSTGSFLPPELEALAANRTGSLPLNSTASSTASSTAGSTSSSTASPTTDAAAANEAGVAAPPALPDLSVPDPYKLLPQPAAEAVDTNVLLATPEEITQALASPGRRLLATSALRLKKSL